MTTVAHVVAQVRDGRLDDMVREAVVPVTRELMEAEVGAGLGEVATKAMAPRAEPVHYRADARRRRANLHVSLARTAGPGTPPAAFSRASPGERIQAEQI